MRPQQAPPGWFAIQPAAVAPARPSGAGRGRAADPLGLSQPSNPLRFLVRKPSATRAKPGNQAGTPPTSADIGAATRAHTQRHRRLLGASGGSGAADVATAFSPQRSLRLAQLPARPTPAPPPVRDREGETQRGVLPAVNVLPSERRLPSGEQARAASRSGKLGIATPLPPPLHELIQTVAEGAFDMNDSAVQFDRASVVNLLMEQWQRQFDDGAFSFKSIGEVPEQQTI